MAGVYTGQWIPFSDQMGRQGWYNPSTGQTTYQMYGAYNAANPMMAPQAQVPVQPQVYQQPPMQVPMGYVAQPQITAPMGQIPQMVPQVPQMPQIMPQVPQQQQPRQPQQQQFAAPPGWQPMFDRSGRRYFYNPSTGQSVYPL
ncbi:unnamed protein product [Ectocarpus sp. 4 AP-2014]